MKQNKKIIILSNTCWYLYNFRYSFLLKLKENYSYIYLVAPRDEYTSLLENRGMTVINWRLNRSSLSPFSAIKSILELIGIYKNIKPDLAHHFTIKACIFGTIAARVSKVEYLINAITGLGPIYFMDKPNLFFIRSIIGFIYKIILSTKNSFTVAQNPDDILELEKINKRLKNKIILIPGSGVDSNYFNRINRRKKFNIIPSILFPARLIKEKGCEELLDACYQLWDEDFKFKLILAGNIDLGNNSSFDNTELSQIRHKKNIIFLGHVDNMVNLYESSDLVVLPSWREGLSKSLLEAASMQCTIITTDVPGCRDIIDHRVNGLLVPLRDVEVLKSSIKYLLLNPQLAFSFGIKAREKVVLNFNINKINAMTLSLYEKIFVANSKVK